MEHQQSAAFMCVPIPRKLFTEQFMYVNVQTGKLSTMVKYARILHTRTKYAVCTTKSER